MSTLSSSQEKAERTSGRRMLQPKSLKSFLAKYLAYTAVLGSLAFLYLINTVTNERVANIPRDSDAIIQRCRSLLNDIPGPPSDFHSRNASDRFAPGTPPVFIRNATIWTGEGELKGDLLLAYGLIQQIGSIDPAHLRRYSNLVTYYAQGAWVTPGLVDMHTHFGVYSAPLMMGAQDGNSRKGPILPWLRSLDGMNTHDESYRLSVSGGVTTSLVIPGSANPIGGQGFTIKLRPTEERSPSSMLLEPPYTLLGIDDHSPPRWRQMKHACGENPSHWDSNNRMDTGWHFRQGYETARKIRDSQDAYCHKALAGHWEGLGIYPHDLQWEALVDVLRGRVKVHTHCYEAVDFDAMVRLTNEFKFPIAAFHHAHEAYLVPEVIKKTWGHTPAIALFSTNARYKRESFWGSEFAPQLLTKSGINVVMKSDHPVTNSRHLIYEAQMAHYFGLPEQIALASVFSTPAATLGMDHRVGYLKKGYDADVVVWDSHPLALGATPRQVFIDGIAQIDNPHVLDKPASSQKSPKTPDFTEEAEEVLRYNGLPPLQPKTVTSDIVVFLNVSSVFMKRGSNVEQVYGAASINEGSTTVFTQGGSILCYGPTCVPEQYEIEDRTTLNLYGGSISPGLVSFGSPLGMEEITGDLSTSDGYVLDPLKGDLPSILGGDGSLVRAHDGLIFSTRNALLAYRSGVTSAVAAPLSQNFLAGYSAYFSTGASNQLDEFAIVQDVVAVHLSIGHISSSSVSSQIGTLRRLLLGLGTGDLKSAFERISNGTSRLVINVESADTMGAIVRLKSDVEDKLGTHVKMTFSGASEAHLIAKQLGAAKIGVILAPSRPFPSIWDSKRILPGPPLSHDSALAVLRKHNVTVALGAVEAWDVRNARFHTAWAGLEVREQLSKAETIALASSNVEHLLGIDGEAMATDLVATSYGSILDIESKVVAVLSKDKGLLHLL